MPPVSSSSLERYRILEVKHTILSISQKCCVIITLKDAANVLSKGEVSKMKSSLFLISFADSEFRQRLSKRSSRNGIQITRSIVRFQPVRHSSPPSYCHRPTMLRWCVTDPKNPNFICFISYGAPRAIQLHRNIERYDCIVLTLFVSGY